MLGLNTRFLGLILLLSSFAHANAGLMLSESTDQGLSRWTSSGHSAVYLSRICPDGPARLRLCAPGEQGSVINNYMDFKEEKPYEWNIVPLSVFLYGVDDPKNRPIYASPALRAALQERFRETRLGDLCPDGPCSDPKANWRDEVGANFVRDIYMFEVSTTVEQDMALIAKFNALPNVDHYSGFRRNCADFARLVINSYFPGAARPDHINDFWMTSPKAIAKSFTHYAVKHPELSFRVVRFTQIPGSYRPSDDARKGTEVLFRTKKWFFPMLFRYDELMMFTASYMITGRFNPECELRRRPSEAVTEQMIEAQQATSDGEFDRALELKTQTRKERSAEFGTKEDWATYSSELVDLRDETFVRGLMPADSRAKDVANAMDAHGRVVLDRSGAIWVEYQDGDRTRRVGVSASNVNDPGSDPEIAYTLLLARAGAEVHNSAKNREMLPEFESDWRLLEDAHRNLNWKAVARELGMPEPADIHDGKRIAPLTTALLP